MMEDSLDLLTTVMAEFSGTLQQETRDPHQEEEGELQKLGNNVGTCILDSPHQGSPPQNFSMMNNNICELEQAKLSDTFCDEIFLELEKTSTFPRFSDWTLKGNELSEHFPSNNASR